MQLKKHRYQDTLDLCVKVYQKLAPLKYPVKVHFVSKIIGPGIPKHLNGLCHFEPSKNRITIHIKKHSCWSIVWDSLIHEWAHAMTAGRGGSGGHGRDWGVAYAKCYRVGELATTHRVKYK